jgi:hypothetical protein
MCELANIDAVWVDPMTNPPVDGIAGLMAIAEVTQRLVLGLALDGMRQPSDSDEDPIGTLAAGGAHGRLEVTLSAARPSAELGALTRENILIKLGLRLEAVSAAECELVARLADDAVLSAARLGGIRHIGSAVDALRAMCEKAGRDPHNLGIALEMPVSLGRTAAEAFARAADEPLFEHELVGQPADIGLFGTLEECQAGALELAHAGLTDLRCWVPNAPDVPDVIAQLTAMVVGRLEVLSPSAPRSRDPDPPAGWGGRSRFPRESQP